MYVLVPNNFRKLWFSPKYTHRVSEFSYKRAEKPYSFWEIFPIYANEKKRHNSIFFIYTNEKYVPALRLFAPASLLESSKYARLYRKISYNLVVGIFPLACTYLTMCLLLLKVNVTLNCILRWKMVAFTSDI